MRGACTSARQRGDGRFSAYHNTYFFFLIVGGHLSLLHLVFFYWNSKRRRVCLFTGEGESQFMCVFITGEGWDVYRLRPGPVRDFGTERALAEPLGPNTTNFPSSWTHFTLLTELNLTVPKARPEAHTFDFIGSGPFVTLEQNGLWQSL